MNSFLLLVLLIMMIVTFEFVFSAPVNKKTTEERFDIEFLVHNLKYLLGGEIENVSKECFFIVMAADKNWTQTSGLKMFKIPDEEVQIIYYP